MTCGSVIKLQNVFHKIRLHSHDVKYGSGSGQQSVTGTDSKEDVNSHWSIKGTFVDSSSSLFSKYFDHLHFVQIRNYLLQTAVQLVDVT